MVGIAGMLAKRNKKKVGDGAAPTPAAPQPDTTTDDDQGNDDPFTSFGERPSTAGSFGFNNIGGYIDDFDDFGGDDMGGGGGGDMDGGDGGDRGRTMDDQGQERQDSEGKKTAATSSVVKTIDVATITPKATGGLSFFKNRPPASKEPPLTLVQHAPAAAQPVITSVVPPNRFPSSAESVGGLSLFKNRSPAPANDAPPVDHVPAPPTQSGAGTSVAPQRGFAPSNDGASSQMDMSFMPPPPPRRPSLSPSQEAPLLTETQSEVAEEVTKNKPDVETFLRMEAAAPKRGVENLIESIPLEATARRVNSFASTSSSRHTVPGRKSPPVAVFQPPKVTLPSPKAVFQTPKPRNGGNKMASMIEPSPPTQPGLSFPSMASLESPLPIATPPTMRQQHQQQQQQQHQQPSTLQTSFLTPSTNNQRSIDSFRRAPVTPETTFAASATENHNNTDGEEGFDDMFCAVLEYVQAIKDKNHVSEEQMLEMEVQLDHVIATMNVEMLQMQQMEDELDEIQRSQEGIVSMYR